MGAGIGAVLHGAALPQALHLHGHGLTLLLLSTTNLRGTLHTYLVYLHIHGSYARVFPSYSTYDIGDAKYLFAIIYRNVQRCISCALYITIIIGAQVIILRVSFFFMRIILSMYVLGNDSRKIFSMENFTYNSKLNRQF